MADQSKSRGWRKDVPTPTDRPSSAQRAWQKEAAAPTQTAKGWSKKAKIALGLGGSLLVVGAIVAVIVILRPARPVYVLAITAGYETNLAVPANVSGRRTADGLERWASDNPKLIEFGKHELTCDDAGRSDWLGDCKKADKVIVFVAVHGGADDKGAYLIPNDVSLENRKLIRVRDLLDQLKKLPSSMQKVLLLDVTQVQADWTLGMLHNDFARALKKLEPDIKGIDNLVVLCASDADQRSLESEEWGTTIFAHSVVEGLKGAADGAGGNPKDTRITAAELYEHVRGSVSQWAHSNRDASQTPILLGGPHLAARMELAAVPEGYRPPEAKEPPSLSADLRTAWKESDDLRKAATGSKIALLPAAYAPHLYRQYLDTLLRYEQLLRAGDDGAAAQMQSAAAELRKKVSDAARLHLDSVVKPDSLQATLTMPAALGQQDSNGSNQLGKQLEKLWADPVAAPEPYRKLIEVPSDPTTTQLRRVRLSSLLVELAQKDPLQNFDKAGRVVAAIDDVLTPRPAESHFLVMLQHDLDRVNGKVALPPELLQKALEVRRLAEEAAVGIDNSSDSEPLPAYTEQVHPWIRKTVVDADGERRLGEDLLFASDNKSWSGAKKHLEAAQNLYGEAQKDALEVRRALKARDQVLAELPYYSQWLARQRLRQETQRRLAEDRIKQVETLWKNVHQLVQLLQQPIPDRIRKDAPAAEPGATNLVQQSTLVNKGFRSLVEAFESHCQELSSAALQEGWHEIEAALTVPFIDPGLRLRLLETSRDISRRLHEQAAKAGASADIAPEQHAALARDRAHRQGRMALAVIGQEWINGPKTRPDYADLEAMVSRRDSEYWNELDKAGQLIGEHWNRMLGRVNTLGKESSKEPLDRASVQLAEAARLARQLDGAAATLVDGNPVDEQRRLQMHDLLFWQAERAYHDHWFAEENKPYYSNTGYLFLNDARNLAGEKRPELSKQQREQRLRRARELEERLKTEESVAFWIDPVSGKPRPSPSEVKWTDEGSLKRSYQVQLPDGVEGYPVVWVKRGRLLEPIGGDDRGRRVLDKVDAKNQSADVSYEFGAVLKPTAVPKKVETEHILHAYFRGQNFEVKTAIALYDQPDIIVTNPEMPANGRVAVQADKAVHNQFVTGTGKLVIVLDASGSMVEEKDEEGKTRWDRAVDALDEVLGKSSLQGVTVSLWVYGQKLYGRQKYTLEDTIQRLEEPSKLKPELRESLMKKVRKLEPLHETPLIRAMFEAKSDLPRNYEGFKTMLVLTDGMDNSFKTDPVIRTLPGNGSIPEFLQKTFENSGILINVIGFQLKPAKDDTITAEAFKKAIENPPLSGKFYDVKDSKQLTGLLERVMFRRLRYFVERDGVPPTGMPEEGLDISQRGYNPQWSPSLNQALYTARVKLGRAMERQVRIGRGDHLLLNLIQKGNQFVFQRDLYGEAERVAGRNVRSVNQNDWLLAFHQNGFTDSGELTAMATLENARHRDVPVGGTIEQIKPRMVWFAVKAQGGKDAGATGLRFNPLPRYRAPAWGIQVAGWRRSVGSEAEAWWTDQGQELSIAGSLRRDRGEFTNLLEVVHREIRNCWVVDQEEQATVVVESIRHEKRFVESRPGEKKEEDCLVVRLSYPKGKPFFANVPNAIGAEHRFYTEAGKYTGVFFRITPELAKDQVNVINLFSLENFKRKAIHVPGLELGVPNPEERRPQPENEPTGTP